MVVEVERVERHVVSDGDAAENVCSNVGFPAVAAVVTSDSIAAISVSRDEISARLASTSGQRRPHPHLQEPVASTLAKTNFRGNQRRKPGMPHIPAFLAWHRL